MAKNAIMVSSDKLRCFLIHMKSLITDAEGERSHPAVSDEQAARYECVELKICSCDNTQFVEMKLQNMSNPELSVEGDYSASFSKAFH